MSITRDCMGAPEGRRSSTRAAEEREQMQRASLCLTRGLERGWQQNFRAHPDTDTGALGRMLRFGPGNMNWTD